MTHEGEGKIYCRKVVIKINNKALPREMYTSVLRECCHVSPKCTNIHTYVCLLWVFITCNLGNSIAAHMTQLCQSWVYVIETKTQKKKQ